MRVRVIVEEMMMEGGCSSKKRAWPKDDFTDMILKWSLHDIFNEHIYKDQVRSGEDT